MLIDLNLSGNLAVRPRAGCFLALTEPLSGRKPVLALLMRLLWAAVLVLPVLGARGGAVLTSLHSFQAFTNGEYPRAGLVQGNDGLFYGTTLSGGTYNSGTVFQISTNGALISLYSFTGGNDGGNPQAALVQGSDGLFYGTTYYGGTRSNGAVFQISTNGVLTRLYSFTGGNDGGNPQAGLVQGSDGYLYGTTLDGGASGRGTNGAGTVFKISTDGALTRLYSFTGINDGANPYAGLVQGNDGLFYGTTLSGGTYNSGTVFQISTNGALTSLYSFTGGNDGANPYAGLVQGSDGFFYGTTYYGGNTNLNSDNGYGTVFKISTNGVLTSLYSFTGGNDGGNPQAGLVQGSDGLFYGTTYYGGTNTTGLGRPPIFFGPAGTVFRISTNGVLTSLYSFTRDIGGQNPQAGLVQGSDGHLYGTTSGGGAGGGISFPPFGPVGPGTLFKISTDGALTNLYSFTGINDGANPYAGLVQGNDGLFYGTTLSGGIYNSGTVFQISTNGALTSLYSFTGGNDGANPYAGLVQGSDGFFYGTTYYGGNTNLNSGNGYGTVFKISTNGVLTTLYSFTGGNEGAKPYAGLVLGSDGNFYGTTYYGGGNQGGVGNGTVFKISPSGAQTTLYSFTGYTEFPSGLVEGSDGYFYGTTSQGGTNGNGTVFKISTNGTLTFLYSFTGGDDSAEPEAGLVRGSDGYFYGTTLSGGTTNYNYALGRDGYGTVFKISLNGALTTLHSFIGGNDGAEPQTPLVQGRDGNFYGTTEYNGTDDYGGQTGYGTVFQISTNGVLITLHLFNETDGATPQAGLVQGSDGSFYGTTASGGQGGAGTVFRLTIVPEPQLTIIPSGPYAILTWPTDYAGFSYAGYTLKSTTNLVSTNWATVFPAPVVVGGQNLVINTISGRQQFYQLSQ